MREEFLDLRETALILANSRVWAKAANKSNYNAIQPRYIFHKSAKTGFTCICRPSLVFVNLMTVN